MAVQMLLNEFLENWAVCVFFIYFWDIIYSTFSDKVSNVETDVSSQTVRVTTDLSSDEILTTLKKTGKEVSLLQWR